MILHAFSQYLHAKKRSGKSPEKLLFSWLTAQLSFPPVRENETDDKVSKILHTEIAMTDINGHVAFEGKTDTGIMLLNSLYQFCRSYDHWQFSKWLHEINASDFHPQTGT